MPFFVSGGADSMIRIFENNPYMAVLDDADKGNDKADPPAKGEEKADGK